MGLGRWIGLMGAGAALSLGVTLCEVSTTINNFPDYHYNGTIGNERVVFEESPVSNKSHLHVTRPDGTQVEYILQEGSQHQLTLEEVVVGAGPNATRFSKDSKAAGITTVVEKAKPDVEKYLSSILEQKTALYK